MAYSIQTRPSGHRFTVEEGESILDGALRQGYRFPYGCRSGNCGACKSRLISGQVDYRGAAISGLGEHQAAGSFALLCQAHPRSDLIIEVQEIGSMGQIPIRTLPCRVAKKQQLSHDVMGLWLKLPRTERLQFLAGQYVDILHKDGSRRSFSLANSPYDDEFLELHIRYYPGGRFAHYVFTELQPNELLRIRGPLGNFVLNQTSQAPMILVAGGTGFAPIKGIVQHTLIERLTRPIHLYWGVRARRDLYMDELARTWAETYSHIRYTPVFSEPLPEDSREVRRDFVHQAVLEDFADLSGYEVYASGPPVMVEAVRTHLLVRGLAADKLYSDGFEFAALPNYTSFSHGTGRNGIP
jgi:CDP-4-dehydro-6-deoxyglucose reductase, E3